jgi:hypothetical protein
MRIFWSLFFVLVAVFCKIDRHFFKSNDSFCPKFIFPNWNRCPKLETKSSDLSPILAQPFRYLTKGKQSFVFTSDDGKWILKFPRMPRAKMRYGIHKDAKESLFENTLVQSQKIADELAKETGIIYAHLKPSDDLPFIQLIDEYQEIYDLDLNDLPFIIQTQGEDFFTRFLELSTPIPLIEKTIALYSSLYEKGFIDRDPILDKNFGISGGVPFIIDTGQIEKCDDLPPREVYLKEMTQSLGGYLERTSPDLYEIYKKLLH